MYKRKGDQQPHETCKKLYGQSRENSTKKKKQGENRKKKDREARRRKEGEKKLLLTQSNA